MTATPGEEGSASPLPGHRPPPWDFLGPAARGAGLVAVGVAPAGEVPAAAAAAYERWLALGLHAGLGFATRWGGPRRDPRHPGMLADAAAVVSAALPYGSGATRAGLWRHVAAHSRGRDYHATLRDRLTVIAAEISARFPTSALRVVVDTAPLAERTWAVLAGIGALGGNGALFVPGSGSRVLLGEIIVAAVPPPIAATGDRPDDPCRGCGRCVAACPTGALRAGGFVDCERCLSYHTIENVRGPVPDAVRAATRLVFGCDACTDACPRNAAAEDRCGLEPPPRAGAPFLALTRIAAMPEAELAALVEGTCLARTGAATLRRSAAHAVAARRAPEEP